MRIILTFIILSVSLSAYGEQPLVNPDIAAFPNQGQYFVMKSETNQRYELVECKGQVIDGKLVTPCESLGWLSEEGYLNFLDKLEFNSKWKEMVNNLTTVTSATIVLLTMGTTMYYACPVMMTAVGEGGGVLGTVTGGPAGGVVGAVSGSVLGLLGCVGSSALVGIITGVSSHYATNWVGSLHFDKGYESVPEEMYSKEFTVDGQLLALPHPANNEYSRFFINQFLTVSNN